MNTFVKENTALMYETLKALCAIPAPSHLEHKRAEYCKKWLENVGAEGVYIDEALNVIFPINAEGSAELTIIVAHTDTVFPDLEPMPYVDDGEKVHCPGVGDDTANVVVLLALAKYIVENKINAPKGLLLVCNSCEEGLGNLKGTRQLFKDFEGRIAQFISFDGGLYGCADKCAGSHRYEVEVTTEGGHSYGKFGNANAIAELAKIITEIYKIQVPQKEGTKTTYNVGGISGGTSVNTIAQSAKMLCEYRSNDRECLAEMKARFEQIFAEATSDKVGVNVKLIGDRPCSNIADEKLDGLRKLVSEVIMEVTGREVRFRSSSTDCNIPLSLGIPAICTGLYVGEGSHTREEWVEKASLVPGLEKAIKIIERIVEG